MDLNAQLMIEELMKLVREELQTLRAEIKQGFTASMSSLTCSEHVSRFAQDTVTTTWTPVSRIGDGGPRDIHVELNTMQQQQLEAVPVQQQQLEAVPVQQQQAPPPVLIHTPTHQQPVVLTPMSPDYLFDLDAVCSSAALLPPSSTSTITDDFMLFPSRAAAPLSTLDTAQSDVIFAAPSTCSTEFPYNCVNAYNFSVGTCAYSVHGDHGGLFIPDSKWLIHVRGVSLHP
jgi:hypothetical protein